MNNQSNTNSPVVSIQSTQDPQECYMNIPTEERQDLLYQLFSDAYVKPWISSVHLAEQMEEVMTEIYKGLHEYRGMFLNKQQMEDIYDKYYDAIQDGVLYGYTEDFKEVIDGGSWGQAIGTSIREILDKLCDRLNITRDTS